tara:strand:+ start:216 stop:695 length:480 start_codon:yes stop_codon:yes gene_type:complete
MKSDLSKVDFDSKFVIMGNAGEKSVIKIINEKFPLVRKIPYYYSTFDFVEKDNNDQIVKVFELKTRNCSINTYRDLCFGYNKLEEAMDLVEKNIRCFFMWYLLDPTDKNNRVLYYWEFTGGEEKQYKFGYMGNPHLRQIEKPSVFVKTEFLKKWEDIVV